MSVAAKLPSSPITPSAANDGRRSPVAETAISDLRAALGRSALESTWAKLTDQAKAMILYGAKLRPSTLISTPLSAMSGDEREQIRMAIIAMQNTIIAFGRQDLSRNAFAAIAATPRQRKQAMPPAITKHRPEKLEALQAMVTELAEQESAGQENARKKH